ncbi:Translocon-associated protein subunit gamma, partial [Ophiophagus hannah]
SAGRNPASSLCAACPLVGEYGGRGGWGERRSVFWISLRVRRPAAAVATTAAAMAPKGSSGGARQQSEEELLLQDFSRNLSAKSSALFFGNAFIVSAIPIWLYWRIWHMDLFQSAVLYTVMTLVSTYLVAFAYKNVKFVLKHKVAQKREDAVSKEVTRKLSEADNRKMSRKEKDERILWKKNEVADYEATTFSIFYNNTLFLVLIIVASFFVLKNFNPTVNYILSISASSGLIALLSTGSK